MQTLEEIAHAFQEKGWTKQATLLRSPTSHFYLPVLWLSKWQEKVAEIIGKDEYQQVANGDMFLLMIQLLEKNHPNLVREAEALTPHPRSVPPLTIRVENQFSLETLKKASGISERLSTLSWQADQTVYNEVYEKTRTNRQLLYRMFKDAIQHRITGESETIKDQTQQEFTEALERRTERLDAAVKVNTPPVVVSKMIEHVARMIFHPYDNFQSVEENAQRVIKRSREVLHDAAQVEAFYRRRLAAYATKWDQSKERKRIIEAGEEKIRAENNPRSKTTMLAQPLEIVTWLTYCESKMEEELANEKIGQSPSHDPFEVLLASSLKIRERFLEGYERDLEILHRQRIGLEQILAGGPITNPTASKVSTLQNHFEYPNIAYAAKTIEHLRAIVDEMRKHLEDLPDISDSAAPTKLKKLRQVTYRMRELAKDPFDDITIGNDSGCCIFVPDAVEELRNGSSISYYFLDPRVRLFGIYRDNNGKKQQRMGLVIAFETRTPTGEKILACNSLELSRKGIVGGRNTTRQLVEYAEQQLIGYAQERHFDGVAMGSHEYNTSVNHSPRRDNPVNSPVLITKAFPLYSDIFEWRPREKILISRPKSLYWLWKKEE
ncbi:hypothetical protein HYS50_03080 [Candidatus Woesearchaeota archaeon]|nr:hypothetical protein [Candidatus Woesearchaeota archaeon]